ncbi:MAG: thiol reductase thioredoxin [Planctomycetaceae bacterium]|nr:thiol reductase thioredoxin [Planctomycetaceae bacterium]
MAEAPKYLDVRAGFWREVWEASADYATYLDDSEADHADKWRDMATHIVPLSPDQSARLKGMNRTVHVLVYTGVWCGDCVRQGPMLQQLVEACDPGVTLRLHDRDMNASLTDELRVLGAMRVPIVVFLTEDFFEIGRFGDRMLTIYRAKATRELGAACSTGLIAPPADELAAERDEWLDIFERMLLMARLSPPLRQRYGD